MKVEQKCYIDDYDIEINSDLTYEEGAGLIILLSNCIELDKEKPKGRLNVNFTDWSYDLPITKADNLRIRKLLKDLGYDRQYVEDIYEYNYCY